jgi:hypothetical protein
MDYRVYHVSSFAHTFFAITSFRDNVVSMGRVSEEDEETDCSNWELRRIGCVGFDF